MYLRLVRLWNGGVSMETQAWIGRGVWIITDTIYHKVNTISRAPWKSVEIPFNQRV